MRLHWFLPPSRSPGRLRRLLRRVGPSWAASPVRRAVQVLSLAAFLVLFLWVCWPYGSRHYADALAAKEVVEAELFLALDPLVALSAALAGRIWVWSLVFLGVLLAATLAIPRGFCGYVCPLGTLIDLFDGAVGRRVRRFRVRSVGRWAQVRYLVLLGVLAAAGAGVLLSGFVAAIPVVTRAMLFVAGPIQTGLGRGFHQVPPIHAGHVFSVGLFVGLLGLSLLRPRFWCRYVCPSGAVLSAVSPLRLTERKVSSACISCGKCREVCPFDAIREGDFTTRHDRCTFCQTCAGACPVRAIAFVPRWQSGQWRPPTAVPAPASTPAGVGAAGRFTRRGLLAAGGALAGLTAGVGIRRLAGLDRARATGVVPVRPPGSLPEELFLQTCVRCGQCIQACPNHVLQPLALEQGVEGLWTPAVVADWSGCEPSCNNCGQVCPTGAVRALPLQEKRAARMGLAVVDATCLPLAGRAECDLCVRECRAAGYDAIEVRRVGVEVDEIGMPVEGTGFLVPEVLAHRCVGCGLCQTRCHAIRVRQEGVLARSAIVVRAGGDREDRIVRGSYRDLEARRLEEHERRNAPAQGTDVEYIVDF